MRVALRRLIQLVVVLVFVSFFSFSLISLVPGDPVVAIVGFASPAQFAQVRHQIGLDRPFLVQYAHWLGGFMHGNLGQIYSGPTGRSAVSTAVNTTWTPGWSTAPGGTFEFLRLAPRWVGYCVPAVTVWLLPPEATSAAGTPMVKLELVTAEVSDDVDTDTEAVDAPGLVTPVTATLTMVLALMVVSGAPVPVSVGTVRVTLDPPPVRVVTTPVLPCAATV